ncbi:MAG TPA: hypothetical protein VFI71_08175, partial [Pyrinomonadaceae bacterium]|nr:hypothetical protein [Pyrinomonadaceae bacterium]
QPAVVAAVNAAASTMATLTATGVVLDTNGSAMLGNGDHLKTTYGDVIKTSHGDPIKKPQLPVWMLPSAPKLNATVLPRAKTPVTPGGCGCGSKN